MAQATFAMGCFWSPQVLFSEVRGVTGTMVGYMGGHTENPTYEDVCSGDTGHAEVVHIEYDPKRVRYDELLALFWSSHDPTTKDRQGPDVGSQYRSAIFYHDEQQKVRARTSKEVFEKRSKVKATTAIAAAGTFYRAEEYHQNFLKKRGKFTCHA